MDAFTVLYKWGLKIREVLSNPLVLRISDLAFHIIEKSIHQSIWLSALSTGAVGTSVNSRGWLNPFRNTTAAVRILLNAYGLRILSVQEKANA